MAIYNKGHDGLIAGVLTLSIVFALGLCACADTWTQIGSHSGPRFVSGEVFNSRYYGGSGCDEVAGSAVYDYPPYRNMHTFGGETVLDFCAFNGTLYSSHENLENYGTSSN